MEYLDLLNKDVDNDGNLICKRNQVSFIENYTIK